MKKISLPNSGSTLLEVMTAVAILSIVTYSIFFTLRTGDRIMGKSNIHRNAALLASNEAERVRNTALRGMEVQNLKYTEKISGVEYTVFRTNINALNIDYQMKTSVEVEIRVEPHSATFPPYTFRFIQGYNQ